MLVRRLRGWSGWPQAGLSLRHNVSLQLTGDLLTASLRSAGV